MKRKLIVILIFILLFSFTAFSGETASDGITLDVLAVSGKAVPGFYTGTPETDFWYGLDTLPASPSLLPEISVIPTEGTASVTYEKIYKGYEAKITVSANNITKLFTLHFREFSEIERIIDSPSFAYDVQPGSIARNNSGAFTGNFKWIYLRSSDNIFSASNNKMAYITYDVPAVEGYTPVQYDMKGIRFYDCYTCSDTGDFHGISVYGYDGNTDGFVPCDISTGNNDDKVEYISGYMVNNFKGWNNSSYYLIANAPQKKNYSEAQTAYTSSFIKEGQNILIFKSEDTRQHLQRMIYDSTHKMPITVRYVEKYPVNTIDTSADISSISVNGVELHGVSSDITEYYAPVADASYPPSVSAISASSNATVSIMPVDGEQTVDIIVTASGGNSKTYKVYYRELKTETLNPVSKFRVYSTYSDDYSNKEYFELSNAAQGYTAYKLNRDNVRIVSAALTDGMLEYNCPAQITFSDSIKSFSTIYDPVNDTFIRENLKGLTVSSLSDNNILAVHDELQSGKGPFAVPSLSLNTDNLTVNENNVIIVVASRTDSESTRTYYYPASLTVRYIEYDDPSENEEIRVVYRKNKNIAVYSSAYGNSSEYGIILNNNENELNLTVENSIKFKADKKNSAGKFGVELTDRAVINDPVFKVRAYWIENSQVHYSEKSLLVNKEEYYGRIPRLSSISLSEGELYPPFNENNFDYCVLLDSIPENIPQISYVKSVGTDSDVYTAPQNISENARVSLNSGFSKSEYNFKFRLKKNAVISANKLLIKESGVVSGIVSDILPSDNISIDSNKTAYIDFNKLTLPEKFIPVSVKLNVSNNVNVYKCTEPYWSERESGFFPASYMPQYEETHFQNGYLNENEFKTKSALSFALTSNLPVTFPANITLELSYYEDVSVPYSINSASSAYLTGLNALGANEIYPAFDKDSTLYYAIYDVLPETMPELIYQTEGKNATATITTDEEGAYITVTSADTKTTKQYTVKFREFQTKTLKLKYLAAKRQTYELFNINFPVTDDKKVPSPYVGRVDNKSGTSWSHLTTMAFETFSGNIAISTAELNLSAATNCTTGINVNFYRAVKTDWTTSSNNKIYYAVTNHFVLKGDEGVLNEPTRIKYVSDYYKNSSSYRYYTIPLKTEGFETSSNINLIYLPEYNTEDPRTSTQNAYIWLGRNGQESQNGLGMLPAVKIKYFVK